MGRRVGLPGASELFRPTADGVPQAAEAGRGDPQPTPPTQPTPLKPRPTRRAGRPGPGAIEHTGRVRHDEKITVYVSSEELLALEHLRLQLRAEHGLVADRGRIVRAAIASALAAIDAQGADADVVQRLAQ